MLISLKTTEFDQALDADVAVIGAGLAGLILADKLASSGLSVVVVESGGKAQDEDAHPLNEVEIGAQYYSGARDGRFRCLGGTSTRWGAALLPFLDADLGPHPCGWHDGWGIDPRDIAPDLGQLEKVFAITHESYEGESKLRAMLPSFLPRLPKWAAFSNRSTANIYRERIASDPNIRVVIDATVTEIRLGAGKVEGLVADSGTGHRLEITTPRVVIAAGAIEATRLLLLLDRAQAGGLFPADGPLGHGFHDHLSAPIADLAVRNEKEFLRLFSFAFAGGGMRNLRFELAPEARARLGLPAAFLHIAFARTGESGFDGLRRVFQAIQRRNLPALADLGTILADWPWFLRAVWWRFVEKRVLAPKGASFELHLVTEQKPAPSNRIGLSATRKDPFGLPLTRIDWQVSDEDRAHFAAIAEQVVAEWNAGPLEAIAEARARPDHEVGLHMVEGGGIFHPAGTTRLGDDATRGVVDTNLRVHGVPGLWLVATSVFPSVGGTSPSLGMLQLALRACRDIAAAAGHPTPETPPRSAPLPGAGE
jgi:choline dehydrogenase-like flavoprotein